MAYLYIENFEGGLDTRKTRFTAPAGSLRQLKNAHITRGKEIERRKAFEQIAVLSASTFGLHAVGDRLFTFGSVTEPAGMPVNVNYVRLQNPSDALQAMTRVYDVENFAGKMYVIAEYQDGRIVHFYDGVEVTDWNTLAADLGTTETIASALVRTLSENNFATVTQYGSKFRIQGAPGETFFSNTSGTNITKTVIQADAAAQPETRATADIVVVSGTSAPGVNTIDAVLVDGVDIIGSPLDYGADADATASALATRINSGVASYDAAAVGDTVTITAPAGLGASANGRTMSVPVSGNVVVNADATLTGGTDPIAAVARIEDFTIDAYVGTQAYDVTLTASGEPLTAAYVYGDSSAMPTELKAFKQKMYAVTGSLTYFSGFRGTYASPGVRNPALPDPTMWINYEDDPNDYGIGAGIINLAEQLGGSEVAVGLAVYQNRLAIFSERSVQIWNVDPDPDLNSVYQVLLNVGSIAAKSITEYGDQDIFFLAESGLRSLRARDSSNIASASDVGVAIDRDISDYVREVGRGTVRKAAAIVEPTEGRYLLKLGARVYVFSRFPGSSVSAWSTYELSAGEVDNWAAITSDLFCRVGNSVRQYGGLDGLSYDTDETVVELPFLDAGQPAQEKQITGVDFGGTGVWEAKMATEPSLPDETDTIAIFDGDTYGSVGRAGVQSKSTHVSMRLTTSQASEAVIGNLIIHYYPIEAS